MAKEHRKPAELRTDELEGIRQVVRGRGKWIVLVDQRDQLGMEAREKTWRSVVKVLLEFPAVYPDISQHLNSKFGISFKRRFSYEEAIELAHWTLEARYFERPKPLSKVIEEVLPKNPGR